jgi:raffinose/stachyose/melibiose transport system permease protein
MTPKLVRLRDLRYHWPVYFLVLPTLCLIALFQYYPAASGIFHSFFRWNGADIAEFVGLENYRDLVRNSEFWQSFKVALILGIWNVIKMIPALAVAVCIHRCRSARLQFFYRIAFVIPMVIPGLVVVLIWRSFFFDATMGYLNRWLIGSGLMHVLATLDQWLHWGGIFSSGARPAWLGDPRLILVACILWGFPWVGSFAVLTHLAKLQNIGRDIYEAAEIDGISWWSKFTQIELPMLLGSMYLLLVFVIIDTLRDAGMILALAGFEGGPGGVVTVPALFMIRKAFLDQQMGYACAVGIILTGVVLLLQKLSTAVLEWEQMPAGRRVLVRVAGAGIGVLVFTVLGWHVVGAAVVLGALPWAAVRRVWCVWQARRAALPAAIARHERAMAALVAREARRWTHLNTRLYRAAHAVHDGALRALKHGFILFVLGCAFLPLYLMLVVSFKSNIQFYEQPAAITQPLHVENWRTAWESVTPSVANSVFVSTSATVLALLLATGAAYFFARLRMPMAGLFWNALLVLMMMPAIANLVPLFRLLRDLNLLNTLSALVIVGATGGQVTAVFVLRNFIADIPQDLFEAAEIDGASHFQQLKMIVLPLSGPILGTTGVMLFVGAWNEFVLPLIVMSDQGRLPVTVQLLRMAGEYIKLWGPLMAGYAIASVPVIVLFVFSMRLFVRGLTEGAVKG